MIWVANIFPQVVFLNFYFGRSSFAMKNFPNYICINQERLAGFSPEWEQPQPTLVVELWLIFLCFSFAFLKLLGGLPWWRSGWESACQCRGHRFEPWSGKIPHAAEQLGPWATNTEPARLEPVPRNGRGRDSERPAHRDEEWPSLAATRESPRTKRRPNTAKNK